MCIAFPGKILSINENGMAVVDISGVRREVCIDLLADEVKPGDYVISHAGYAIQVHRRGRRAGESCPVERDPRP